MRLRPVVDDRPKVLAPIAGSTFLDHLLRFLKGQGVSDVVLSTGYLGEMPERANGTGFPCGMHTSRSRLGPVAPSGTRAICWGLKGPLSP